ncbi:hypothetical protein J5N97_027067 [Dioscorea zingiberensis]|uniref:Uncharacterized protein n=1 Tax=Dioscorea zingiberensis TaxID=325984 RepID=A0A9D5H798_9LILI|nr:hypothetical protein J5N97_027067 [Dioscorea zingiberensis]
MVRRQGVRAVAGASTRPTTSVHVAHACRFGARRGHQLRPLFPCRSQLYLVSQSLSLSLPVRYLFLSLGGNPRAWGISDRVIGCVDGLIFARFCWGGCGVDRDCKIIITMGGACSRKRDLVDDEDPRGGVTGRCSKSGSSKQLMFALSRSSSDALQRGKGKCPSLMELCVRKICEDIGRYNSFFMLPRDVSQQIFDEMVRSHRLSESHLEAFRDCALQDIHLGEYPGVKDSWMDIISSQGQSLLSLDVSYSDITDSGLSHLKDCSNLQNFTFNFSDQISCHGLEFMSGLSNLTSLSFKRSNAITAEGMKAFTHLVNLVKLDLERCLKIHGGLVHLKGLKNLESLNFRCCNCITDTDMKPLSGLTNLKELQMSCTRVTDAGISYLTGLHKLTHLNLEGCPVTAACLEFISGFLSLLYLNLNRCGLSDNGCEKFADLVKLKILNLGFNNITDACLVHLKDLSNLESLNLDSCKIGDEGLLSLKGLLQLKSLELSDTEVGSNGLCHLSGLHKLENINLSFTLVTDSGLKKLSGLTSLKSLNLDARQITDAGLSALTSLTGLTHLDLLASHYRLWNKLLPIFQESAVS